MTTIRPANIGDVLAIRQVLRETWIDTYRDYLSQETLDEVYKNWHSLEGLTQQVQDKNTYFLVAVAGERIVGMATAGYEDEVTTMYRLYVLPDQQRKGIGKQLLRSIIARFPDAKKMYLHVEALNKKGVAFYLKEGFTQVGTEQDVLGAQTLEAVVMEKAIG